MGALEILNVGAGDVKITFDKDNAAEAIRAKRIIKDMLKRGYALLVREQDGTFSRAKAFDAETAEYIIADYDPDPGDSDGQVKVKSGPAKLKSPRTRERRVPMSKARATAVGRSAGG